MVEGIDCELPEPMQRESGGSQLKRTSLLLSRTSVLDIPAILFLFLPIPSLPFLPPSVLQRR